MEKIMDAMGGSLQEEQLLCCGTYLPRETTAFTSILLVALKDVSSAHPILALHDEQQRQDTGCRHSSVATTSLGTQPDNHVLALGLHQTAT